MTNTVSIKLDSFLRETISLKVKSDSEVKIDEGARLLKLDTTNVDIVNNYGGSPDVTEIDGEVWAWLTEAEYNLFIK